MRDTRRFREILALSLAGLMICSSPVLAASGFSLPELNLDETRTPERPTSETVTPNTPPQVPGLSPPEFLQPDPITPPMPVPGTTPQITPMPNPGGLPTLTPLPPESLMPLDDTLLPASATINVAPLAATPTESMVVPIETVLYIKLKDVLSSETGKVGDVVSATIDEPLNLGPYTVIPAGSAVEGQITHVNNQVNNNGYNPYVVVQFNKLKRPEDKDYIAFDGALIAYKSGMRKQDYVWRLPKPGDRKRSHIKNVVGGAVSGAMFNPIIGAPIGMAAGLLKSVFANRIAHGGNVMIQPEKVLPISVKRPFLVPMSEMAMKPTPPLEQPMMQGEVPVTAPTNPQTLVEPTNLPESTLHEEIPASQPITK